MSKSLHLCSRCLLQTDMMIRLRSDTCPQKTRSAVSEPLKQLFPRPILTHLHEWQIREVRQEELLFFRYERVIEKVPERCGETDNGARPPYH